MSEKSNRKPMTFADVNITQSFLATILPDGGVKRWFRKINETMALREDSRLAVFYPTDSIALVGKSARGIPLSQVVSRHITDVVVLNSRDVGYWEVLPVAEAHELQVLSTDDLIVNIPMKRGGKKHD